MGTPEFAVSSLRSLHAAGHEIALVVAQPDRPGGRGQQVQCPPTIRAARELSLPTAQPARIKSGEFPELWESLRLDLAVVVAYGRILTPRLLTAPAHGCVNVHASLLPRWRGAAPIQWSILGGDEFAGVTTMQMAEGLDTGDMLLQESTPIGVEETAGELHDRLAALGAALIARTLASIPAPIPQDAALATHAPMLDREMGRVDWANEAAAIHLQVRGLSPWPGTFSVFRGEVVKVLRVRRSEGEGRPGELLARARVACGAGAIELLSVQLPGKKAVSGADFMNGARPIPGECLGAAATR